MSYVIMNSVGPRFFYQGQKRWWWLPISPYATRFASQDEALLTILADEKLCGNPHVKVVSCDVAVHEDNLRENRSCPWWRNETHPEEV